jgi:short-subunit dehydrogenase
MSETTRVLVTGATSGLGREMVRQLAQRGYRVAFTGRRTDRLEETRALAAAAGPTAELLPLAGSVTDRADVARHHEAVVAAWGGIDWLILNAGVGDTISGLEFAAEHVRWIFETNLFGAANWLEVALPAMIARGAGVVVGLSSLAGVRGLPTSAGYSASKAALTTMLESLRVDLRRSGVKVLTVLPGYIKSEITARNDPRQMLFLLETEDGVRRILRGIDRRNRYISFPWQLSWLCRLVLAPMPIWIYDRIASRIKRKKEKYVDLANGPHSETASSDAAAITEQRR